MADKQVRIRLSETGAEQTAAAIGKVDSSMAGLAKTAIGLSAAYFSAAGLISALKYSTNEAVVAEDAQRKLAVAYGKNTKALLDFAGARQRVTRFDDDGTTAAMAAIAAFTKEEKAIKALTIAAQDMAEAKGMDLASAADLVGKSFGASTNALARYGVEVTAAAGSSERLEQITRGIANLWGGQATAAAQSLGGQLAQTKFAIDDTAKALGEALAPILNEVLPQIKTMADYAAELTKHTQSIILFASAVAGDWTSVVKLVRTYGDAVVEVAPGTENVFSVVGVKAREAADSTAAFAKAGQDARDAAGEAAPAIAAVAEQTTNLLNLHRFEIEAYQTMVREQGEYLQGLYEQSSFGEQAHLARMAQMQAERDTQRSIWEEDQDWLDRLAADDVQRVKNRREAYIAFAASTVSSLAAVNSALKGSKAVTLALMQAEGGIMAIKAGINTTEEMSKYLPFPLPQIMGATVAAGQLAQVAQMGRYDSGGYISGHGGTRSDSVPAMLSRGEGVLNAATVARIGGESAIHALNAGAKMGGSVTVQFHGPVTDRDYVRDFIIPEIRKAVSRA